VECGHKLVGLHCFNVFIKLQTSCTVATNSEGNTHISSVNPPFCVLPALNAVLQNIQHRRYNHYLMEN